MLSPSTRAGRTSGSQPTCRDRLFRFIPKEGRFITYRLPTRGTYTREFFFPADGRICSPASPLPAAPDVIEGGMDTIVCLDLGG
jgi:hypothetical protein